VKRAAPGSRISAEFILLIQMAMGDGEDDDGESESDSVVTDG
jgi:hypothetical protein